jgi:hypothetical protein
MEVAEVAVRVSLGCLRFRQPQYHYAFIDLPNVSRVVMSPSFFSAANELLRNTTPIVLRLQGEYPSVRPRHTVKAVAQIFPITSLKFRWLTNSGPPTTKRASNLMA